MGEECRIASRVKEQHLGVLREVARTDKAKTAAATSSDESNTDLFHNAMSCGVSDRDTTYLSIEFI